MPFYWRRRYRRNWIEKIISEPEPSTSTINDPDSESVIKPDLDDGTRISTEISFARHMEKYIGETVTIFVPGGGYSGNGFTGILLNANNVYIKLLIGIGPAPACSPGNPCIPYYIDSYKSYMPFFHITGNQLLRPVSTVGSIANIPTNKVISFVHNTI